MKGDGKILDTNEIRGVQTVLNKRNKSQRKKTEREKETMGESSNLDSRPSLKKFKKRVA